ncbi:MAG: alpha-glucan family phosphorylase, partial [Gammaproteobacteria bacterium]
GSRFRNGVSRIHGGVAAEMAAHVWPEIQASENPVGYVTNGADVDSYMAAPWVSLFEMYMGGGWRAKLTDTIFWQRFIDDIPDHVFLSVRQILKAAMLEDVKRRALIQFKRCAETRSMADRLTRHLGRQNKDTLVIGFARRFATYKRAGLLFRDAARLARLVNDPARPVILVFAGKAHPNDLPGQQLLKEVCDYSMRPDFQGRLFVLENYNLAMTREFLPGVDVWLNTPDYPMEACGTSGMKAAINGVTNLSVLDGWWAEAYNGNNGWAITPHPDLDRENRDRQEADELMNILEYQVIPRYYARNQLGEPEAWVATAKASMKSILPSFNTTRMAMDYLSASYGPAARQGRLMRENQGSGAKQLAEWRKKISANWSQLRARLAQPVATTIGAGESLVIDVEVDLNGLEPEDIIVECLLGTVTDPVEFSATHSVSFDLVGNAGNGTASYQCDLGSTGKLCSMGGLQRFKVRIYPYHRLMSHPLECGRMLWL